MIPYIRCGIGTVAVRTWRGSGKKIDHLEIRGLRAAVALHGAVEEVRNIAECRCRCRTQREESGLPVFYVREFCRHRYRFRTAAAPRERNPAFLCFMYASFARTAALP